MRRYSYAIHRAAQSFLSFRNALLTALDGLIAEASDAELSRRALIPPEISPAAGRGQLVILTHLALHCGLGPLLGMSQFLFGFKLVGGLSKSSCYPDKPKDVNKTPENMERIYRTASKRFTERATKSGYENAQSLRGEAIRQTEKGRRIPPLPLSNEENPFVPKRSQMNVAFRFGVDQSDNLRARDDLRHARTNLAFVVETPINLVRWGHLDELSNLVKIGERDWAFFKADREAA